MAFEALTDQFPIDARGANLAYAQSATMVELVIRDYGREAMATIAGAYRTGATDAEAIEAGTGVSFDQVRAEYFAEFGVAEPAPVEPLPLGRSDVPLPPQPGDGPAASAAPEPGSSGSQDLVWWLIIGFVVLGAVFIAAVVLRARRLRPPARDGW
jgi:hypothetical protein